MICYIVMIDNGESYSDRDTTPVAVFTNKSDADKAKETYDKWRTHADWVMNRDHQERWNHVMQYNERKKWIRNNPRPAPFDKHFKEADCQASCWIEEVEFNPGA